MLPPGLNQMSLFHKDIFREQMKATLLYYVFLPAAVVLPGFLLDHWLNLPRLPHNVYTLAAASLAGVLGLVFITWSTLDLDKKGHGTPSPFRPAKVLVTSGSYRFCRHPMFFGYDLVLLAGIILLRSLASLVICYPVLLGWSIWLLRQEEKILALRFREGYFHYQQRVAFFIPLLTVTAITRFIRRKEPPDTQR